MARHSVTRRSRGGVEWVEVVDETGRVHRFAPWCPHAGAALDDGWVADGALVCPRHGWAFDLETGRCRRPGAAALERIEPPDPA